jgi:hypothetical protein
MPKIKRNVWRVYRGCFCTCTCLSSRRVHCPIDCVLWGSNYEDSIHVLLECPGVVQVGCDANLWVTIDETLCQNYNMDALIFYLLQQLPSAQSDLFVTIMWRSTWVWKCGNNEMRRACMLWSVQPISLRTGELHNVLGLKEQHVPLFHKVVLAVEKWWRDKTSMR